MLRRLARALVLKYPAPWRERYETEVLSLIGDYPVRSRDLGELVRGLIVERARALIEDADHPQRTAAILGWTLPLFVILFMLSAWGTGFYLRAEWPLPQTLDYLGSTAYIVWMCAFWPVVLVRQRRVKGRSTEGSTFSPRTGLALMPVVFLVVVLGEWGYAPVLTSRVFSPGFEYGMNVFRNASHQGIAAGVLAASFWPRRRLLQTLVRLANLETGIVSAQTWVDGCRTMNALGVPSPSDVAQAAVDCLRREREGVLEELHGLGYGAGFR